MDAGIVTEGMNPSQFQILREDIRAVNLRLDNLVSRETFTDERRRVDDRFDGQGREIGELKRDIAAEAQARVTQAQHDVQAKLAESKDRDKLRRQTSWQWFALAASIIGGPIIGGLIGAAISSSGIGAG